jgi:chemotaxis protein MotB
MRKFMMLILAAGSASLFQACVPSRLLDEAKMKGKQCEEDLSRTKSEARECQESSSEIRKENEEFKKQVKGLERDTLAQGKHLAMLTKNYDKLNETYNLLLEKNRELDSETRRENRKLVSDLQLTQEQLQRREDRLKKLQEELDVRQASVKKLEEEVAQANKDLQERSAKVAELQTVLSRKDSAVAILKKKVSEALLGFENQGLTIQQKNGKVYVSLEERLLFASGSTNVDPRGVEALRKLAKVLESNADINVMIEGHTDNVPFNGAGGGIKDNWDLSVLRATSIVKILTGGNKVDPTRLQAAGRGEFLPIDPSNSAEARRKNRRTEIILTPKLDELFKVLESN